MAVLKRSLRRKNASGNYDTIRLESDSSIVYRPSGRTVEQDLAAYLPSTQSSDVVPKTLSHGKIVTGQSKLFAGILDNIVELETIPNNRIDTSDATAAASDILEGKTAYVNGQKITGNAKLGTFPFFDDNNTTYTAIRSQYLSENRPSCSIDSSAEFIIIGSGASEDTDDDRYAVQTFLIDILNKIAIVITNSKPSLTMYMTIGGFRSLCSAGYYFGMKTIIDDILTVSFVCGNNYTKTTADFIVDLTNNIITNNQPNSYDPLYVVMYTRN